MISNYDAVGDIVYFSSQYYSYLSQHEIYLITLRKEAVLP